MTQVILELLVEDNYYMVPLGEEKVKKYSSDTRAQVHAGEEDELAVKYQIFRQPRY